MLLRVEKSVRPWQTLVVRFALSYLGPTSTLDSTPIARARHDSLRGILNVSLCVSILVRDAFLSKEFLEELRSQLPPLLLHAFESALYSFDGVDSVFRLQ